MTAENVSRISTVADDRVLVDRMHEQVWADGAMLDFTPVEFGIFSIMAAQPYISFYRSAFHTSKAGLRSYVRHMRPKFGAEELADPKEGVIRAGWPESYYVVDSLEGIIDPSECREEDIDLLADGKVIIHRDKRLVTVNGKIIHLTPLQYRIFSRYGRQPGVPVSHPQICEENWDDANLHTGRETLRQTVHALHHKIGEVDETLGDPDEGVLRVDPGNGYYAVA